MYNISTISPVSLVGLARKPPSSSVTAKDAEFSLKESRQPRRYSLGLPANSSFFDNSNPATPCRSRHSRAPDRVQRHREALLRRPVTHARSTHTALFPPLWGMCTSQALASGVLATRRYMRYRWVPLSHNRRKRYSLKELSAAKRGPKARKPNSVCALKNLQKVARTTFHLKHRRQARPFTISAAGRRSRSLVSLSPSIPAYRLRPACPFRRRTRSCARRSARPRRRR